jgi:phosphomannomutase
MIALNPTGFGSAGKEWNPASEGGRLARRASAASAAVCLSGGHAHLQKGAGRALRVPTGPRAGLNASPGTIRPAPRLAAVRKSFVTEQLSQQIDRLSKSFPPSLQSSIAEAEARGQFWEIAGVTGAFMNTPEGEAHRDACVQLITAVREFQGQRARTSEAPATIVFGTSGWRDVIGEGFTILNVHKVVRGIIEMMQSPEFLVETNFASFDEVKKAGVLLLRDNRYMGDEFIAAAEAELTDAGIRTFNAGECPTGVGSAVLTELGGAGSINFTPSHNPMEYAGIKFNPRDGGPADPALTQLIERNANRYMTELFKQAGATDHTRAGGPRSSERVDAREIFTRFVETKSRVFDLARLRRWLIDHREDLFIVIDYMHGASRGYIDHLLGSEVVEALLATNSLVSVNTNEDYSFHGVKPEPSAKNQKPLIDALKKSGRKFTLAAALDPDADRIRCADAALDVDMNRFGAIAYANLLRQGVKGGVASTTPSSDFGLEIAKREGMEVFETAVGFKNFRKPLGSGAAIVAFEESDGISFAGHTLEKCAVGGFLAALDCIASSGTNLSEQYDALRAKYGYFYPDKAGAEIKGITVDAWQRHRRAVEAKLKEMFRAGDSIDIGGTQRTIAEVNTLDGTKLIFDDRSWILVRSSGTEPKFRYYFEVASDAAIADIESRLAAYRDKGAEMLATARAAVE